jgi:hypothetical protein
MGADIFATTAVPHFLIVQLNAMERLPIPMSVMRNHCINHQASTGVESLDDRTDVDAIIRTSSAGLRAL